MICKICGQDVKNKGITSHLRKHKLTDKEYYDKYIKSDNNGICKICGKPTKFFGNVLGYGTYCSNSCAQLDPDTRNKCKQTCLDKYGAENVYASDYGKDRIKETCLEKFGTEYAFQSKVIQDKIKQTNIKKYGVENPQQNKEIKDKTTHTNLIKYGNACAVHNPDIWNKAVSTMKKNGNYSSLEDYLERYFISNNIEYKSNYSKDARYPYHCDFYLPKFDLFIEINNYWHHNTHFYDKSNKNDRTILQLWKEKAETRPQYKIAIEVWTKRDVAKLQCATKNKLNYIVLWNKNDIDDFIQNFTNSTA